MQQHTAFYSRFFALFVIKVHGHVLIKISFFFVAIYLKLHFFSYGDKNLGEFFICINAPLIKESHEQKKKMTLQN